MRIIPGLAIACSMWAQAPVPGDRPAPRIDQNSMIAHQELLAKSKQGRIDVYFEGDSITMLWGATDYPELLANWKQNFFAGMPRISDGARTESTTSWGVWKTANSMG